MACTTARPVDMQATYPPAAVYSTRPAGAAAFVAGVPSPALRATVESSAAARGIALHADGRLGLVARFVADGSDRAGMAELAARHLGVSDPVLDASLLPLPGDPAAALAPLFAAKFGLHAFTHFGVAVVARDGQRWLSLVLTVRRLALEPVARSVPQNTPIQLHGWLPDGVINPRVELLLASAPRALLSLGSDREFSVRLPTPRSGLYRIEIAADTESGSVTLAKLPVYVGTPVPPRIEPPRARQAYDLAALRARVFASLNRERQRVGLAALTGDTRLDAIAQQHSLDMIDHGFIGHESPRTGDPKQRVSRAGLSPALVLETLARGADATGLEASVVDPSGEGRNLLTQGVTHVGIAVVAVPDAHGSTLLATELFAQLAALPDPAAATPRLLSQLNVARAKRGNSPLSLDAGLSEVAARAAQRFMSDPALTEQQVIDAAQRELGEFSLAYRRVNALLTVTHDVEDAAALEPALDARAGGLGIGIVQGERAEHGVVLAVVMIVGVRR
jgi:uncharacterized protein YkwD